MKRRILISSIILLCIQTVLPARELIVPVPYLTIQAAIDAAVNGDRVLIMPGTYTGSGNRDIDFKGKAVTVMSFGFNPANPDWNKVNTTIVDCGASATNSHRAFYFHNNEGPNSKIIGITIKNGFEAGLKGTDATSYKYYIPDATYCYTTGNPKPDDYCCIQSDIHHHTYDYNIPPPAKLGGDKDGSNYGGAILCGDVLSAIKTCSPTIQYCRIIDCNVAGGIGGNGGLGMNGQWSYFKETEPNGTYITPNGQWGGKGGTGSGYGYGGAIACLDGSSPVISNCIIENNMARGGIGGKGGHGGNAAAGGARGRGGDGGDASGDGLGGAIYCEGASTAVKSKPIITDCTFIYNDANAGGKSGDPNKAGAGNTIIFPCPMSDANGSSGTVNSSNSNGGGAVYAGAYAEPNFTRCTFTNNQTTLRGGGLYSDVNNTVYINTSGFTGNAGGAIHCKTGCTLKVNNTDPNYLFSGNTNATNGGAVYIESGGSLWLNNYSFNNNQAIDDGGALFTLSNTNITNCFFNGNKADSNADHVGNGGAISCYSNVLIDANICAFSENQAYSGGSVYLEGYGTSRFSGCTFLNNDANYGGALSLVDVNNTISGSIISGNAVTSDYGGGILCIAGKVEITGCILKNNSTSYGSNYASGGAVDFWAGSDFLLKNCLLTGNSSVSGGAVSCFYAEPNIVNCTFSGNSALDSGSAIFIGYDSEPNIVNSIFNNCNKHAVHEDPNGNAKEKYCLFYNNPDGSYYDSGTKKVYNGGSGTYSVRNIPGSIIDGKPYTNLYGDPVFVSGLLGDFYLRQYPSEPTPPYSPAVNSGRGTALSLGLNTFTTSTTDDDDTGIVDMGYHYPKSDATPAFLLVTGVVNDRGGTIEPASGYYPAGTIVTLIATPESGWRIKAWHGTDNDSSKAGTNTVIMNRDKLVTVEFEPDTYYLTTTVVGGVGGTIEPPSGNYPASITITLIATPLDAYWRVKAWHGTDNDASIANTNTITMDSNETVRVEFEHIRTLSVGPDEDYATIQRAITDAKTGDIIIVSPGVWYSETETGDNVPSGIVVNKSVTIRSVDPNNPEATVIDGTEYVERGLYFGSGTDSGTVLDGFTIRNFSWNYCFDCHVGDPQSPRRDGYDGLPAEGGGIYVDMGGTVTIKNCIIRDNRIGGLGGSNGVDATAELNAGRGGWGGWARGAGAYCSVYSSVKFQNCQFINNFAKGGDGGDGGSRGDATLWANYGGNWSMDGTPQSPAIYIDAYSANHWDITDGGLWKHWRWDSARWDTKYQQYYPWLRETEPNGLAYYSYYGDYRWYSGYGGAVYCDIGSNVTFAGCRIKGNVTFGGMSGSGGAWPPGDQDKPPEIPYQLPSYGGGVYCAANSIVEFIGCEITDNAALRPSKQYHLDPYLGHGGGVCAEDSAMVTFQNCLVGNNDAAIGGGIFDSNANPRIIDSRLIANSAYHGGGIYGLKGEAMIINCALTGNTAGGVCTNPQGEDNDPCTYDPNNNYHIYGSGAAIYCNSTEINIADSNITDNKADGSGGGVYLTGPNTPVIFNCLLANNTAGSDGGGVSNNTFSNLTLANCTITANNVTGTHFPNPYTPYGGGLSCLDMAYTDVINSVLWGNFATSGPQIALRRGTQGPAKVRVHYSDIQNGALGVFIDTGCTLIWSDANNLPGSSGSTPRFVSGYHLSQVASGQSPDSPCINVGSSDAATLRMYRHTTRTDGVIDGEGAGTNDHIVDLGYHYILTTDLVGDLNFDGIVDMKDIAILHSHWRQNCGFPDWCEGADLNMDGTVNVADYAILTANYYEMERVAPKPDPMTWAVLPYAVSANSIKMKATKAKDNSGSGVEYWFDCVLGRDANGTSSTVWQNDPNYTNNGLKNNTEYGYRVKARDKSTNKNETGWSFVGYAVTAGGPVNDTLPAAPGNLTATATSSSQINLSWTDNSTNETGFKIERKTGSGSYSQIATVSANTTSYGNTGLSPSTTYTYHIRAYNSVGDSGFSNEASATTSPPNGGPDTTPPLPNPSQWAVHPVRNDSNDQVYMAAVTASDATTGGNDPVSYYFNCTSGGCPSSTWQSSPIYTFNFPSHCVFRVRTKDNVGNIGQYSESWYTGW